MTTTARWRKATASTPNGNCVEIRGDLQAVRDSKNLTGPTISGDVTALVRAVRDDRIR